MSSRFEKLYNALLESNEIKFFLPKFKGNWEEDSKEFIKVQRQMEEIVNIDVEDAEII